jgi:hypothetical protein
MEKEQEVEGAASGIGWMLRRRDVLESGDRARSRGRASGVGWSWPALGVVEGSASPNISQELACLQRPPAGQKDRGGASRRGWCSLAGFGFAGPFSPCSAKGFL